MSIKIESIKNKTGIVVTHSESADNATHATNADQATRALAVPATGIEGLTVSGDIKKTTENDTVNLSVDVPIFVGDFTTSFAEWKAAFDAGKRLEFKNIVSTDIVIPADQIPDNGEDDENIYHEDDPEIDETEENEEEEEPEDYTETLTFNDIKLFYEKWEEYQEEDGPKAPVEDEPTYNESIVVTMANEDMYLAFYLDENDIWTVYLVGSIGYRSGNTNTIEIWNFSDYPYYYYDVAHNDEPEIDEEDEEEPYIPYYHPGILFVGHLDNDWKKIMDMFGEWWGYEYEEPHPFSYVTSEEAYMAFDGGLNFITDGNYLLPSYLKVFYAEFNGVVTISQPAPDTFVCYDYKNKKIWYVHLSHYDYENGFLRTSKQEIEVGSSGGADGIFIGYMNTEYQEWRKAAYDYQNKVCYLYLNYNENVDSPCLLPMTWKPLSFTHGDGPTFTTPDDSFAYYKVYIEVDSYNRYNWGIFQTYNGEIVFEYDERPDLLNPKVYPFFTYYGWDYKNERNCETNSTEFLQDFEEKFKPKLLVEDTTKDPYKYKLYDYVSDKWSDYDEEHDCPVCNGTGQIEGQTCEFCEGTGKVNWNYYNRKFTFQRITDKIEKYEVIEEYLPYKPIYDEETETWDWGCEDYYETNYEANKLPDEGFGTSNVLWKTEDFVKTETNDSLILYLEHKYFMPDVSLKYNKLGLVKNFEDSTETFECKFKVKVDSSLQTPSTLSTNFKANVIGTNSLEPDKEYIISIFENNIKIEEISSTIHVDLDLINKDYLVIISNTDQPYGYDENTFELVDIISSDEDNSLNSGEYKLIFISKLPNVEMDETNNYIESFKNCHWILSVVDGRLGGEINS